MASGQQRTAKIISFIDQPMASNKTCVNIYSEILRSYITCQETVEIWIPTLKKQCYAIYELLKFVVHFSR